VAVVPFVLGASGFGAPPAPGRRLAQWLDRCLQRDSVAKTAAEAEAVAGIVARMVPAMIEKGAFQREYRDHRLEWMIKSGGVEVVLKGLERDNIRFSPAFR
jgi:glutathione S-transferase/RNA polymerase-associated protein